MIENLKDIKLRASAEMKAWLAARARLRHRSMNAEIVALLGEVLENDPLTRLRIIEDKGRYVTASAFTGEQFRAYAGKFLAETAAREALNMIGAAPTNVIDQTAKEAPYA